MAGHPLTSATIETESRAARAHRRASRARLRKVTDRLNALTRQFIERSPFLCLATSDATAAATSARAATRRASCASSTTLTLLVPERPGNRIADSLRNILEEPARRAPVRHPGRDATRSASTVAPRSRRTPRCSRRARSRARCRSSASSSTSTSAYTQCSKAFLRSHLWDPERLHRPRGAAHERRDPWRAAGRRLRRRRRTTPSAPRATPGARGSTEKTAMMVAWPRPPPPPRPPLASISSSMAAPCTSTGRRGCMPPRTRRSSRGSATRDAPAAKKAAPRATAARAPSPSSRRNARGERTYRAINSCITLLPMVAGREIVTVEGVAARRDARSTRSSSAMVEHYGSQCGYCTPGLRRLDVRGATTATTTLPTTADREDRRPAQRQPLPLHRLSPDPRRDAARRSPHAARASRRPLPAPPRRTTASSPAARLRSDAGGQTFLRPTTLAELLALRPRIPKAELVAGATEIGVYINKQAPALPAPHLDRRRAPSSRAITKTRRARHDRRRGDAHRARGGARRRVSR